MYGTLPNANDYNTSQLAHWFLTRVPRLGTNFQALHNVTLESTEYGTAMAMYSVLAAIAFAVGSLLLLGCCCCNIVMFRAWPKYGEQVPRSQRRCMSPVKFTVLLLAILGASSFALGFVGEFRVHTVTTGACDTVTLINERVHLIKHDVDTIVQQMNITEIMEKLQTEMETVKSDIAQISPAAVASIKQYSEFLEKLQNEILQTSDSIKEKIIGDTLEKVLTIVDPISEQCPKVSQWAHLLSILLIIVLLFSSLLFIVGLYRQCLRFVACLTGYLFWLALFAIGTLAFVALISCSDFCVDGKANIDRLMPTPVNDYYLHCPSQAKNKTHLQCSPVSMQFTSLFDGTLSSPSADSSSNSVNSISGALAIPDRILPPPPPHLPSIPSFTNESVPINVMVHQAGCFVNQSKAIMAQFGDAVSTTIAPCNSSSSSQSISAPINHLCEAIHRMDLLIIGLVKNGTNSTNNSSLLGRLEVAAQCMGRIEENVDCSSVTPRINRHLGEICGPLFDAFFVYLLNSLLAIVLFFLLQLLSIWLICTHTADDDDDPYTPSAPPSAHINPRVQLNLNEFVWKEAQKGKKIRFEGRQPITTVL